MRKIYGMLPSVFFVSVLAACGISANSDMRKEQENLKQQVEQLQQENKEFRGKLTQREEKFPFDKKELIGVWHDGPAIGAGYGEKYHIHSNGKFDFTTSQYDCTRRLMSKKGTWSINGSKLILSAEEKVVLEGGSIQESGMCEGGKDLVDATSVTKKMEETVEISFSGIKLEGEAGEIGRLYSEWNDIGFWKIHDDSETYLDE